MLHRDVQLVAGGVLEDQVLSLALIRRRRARAGELGDAVLDVDNEVPRPQLREERLAPGRSSPGGPPLLGHPEYLGVAEQHELVVVRRQGESLGEPGATRLDDGDGAGTRRPAQRLNQLGMDPSLLQDLPQPLGKRGDGDDPVGLRSQLLSLLGELVQPAQKARRRGERKDKDIPVCQVVGPPRRDVQTPGEPVQHHLHLGPQKVRRREVAGELPSPLFDLSELVGPLVGVPGGRDDIGWLAPDQYRVLGEVVQQAAVVEEARIELELLYVEAVQQRVELLCETLLCGAGAIRYVHRGQAPVQLVAAGQGRQRLGGGDDGHRIDDVGGELGHRIEPPNAVYLVSPQLYADRRRRGDREYVEDPATAAHVSRRLRDRPEPVPNLAPQVQQVVQVDLVVRPKGVPT